MLTKPSERDILDQLESNMLRLKVNDLTLRTGHGDIRLANGNRVAIGGSSGGATRRLLDGYLLPDIPDLESLHATDMELLEADAREQVTAMPSSSASQPTASWRKLR